MNASIIAIDEVLEELDKIIEESVRENSYLGVFAYLYRRTTAQIKYEIEQQGFEDNERMARFDVEFAKLYINAYRGYKSQTPISRAWELAFEARNEGLSIIQHLTMGMNTHINLDLGVAASKVMEGDDIRKLKNDYYKVNEVLAGLIDEMQSRIARVSRLMFLLDWLGRKRDERLIHFSISKARNESWKVAKELSALPENEKEKKITEVDFVVTEINRLVKSPVSRPLKWTLRAILLFETRDIERIIRKLRE